MDEGSVIQLTSEQVAAFHPDTPAVAQRVVPEPIQLTPEQAAAFRPDPAPDPRFVDTEEPPTGAAARQYPTNYNRDVADIQAARQANADASGATGALAEKARIEGELAATRASLTPARTEEEDLGALDAAGRSATNLFGLGPTLSAVQQKALSVLPGMAPVDFDEARRQALEQQERSAAQHPIAALAGMAPRVVLETELGGAAAGAAGKVAPKVAAKVAALPSAAKHAATGASYGAAAAGGEAISREKPIEDVVADTARGAVLGGTVGRVLGPAAQRLVKGAEHRADDWIVKEIVGDEGKSGSTATTRMQLKRDANDVRDVVKRNPDLKRALADGIAGKPEQIEQAAATNQKHIDRVFAPREKLHAEADTHARTTLGDVLRPIKARQEELARHINTKNVRKALDAVAEDFKEVYGGGSRRVIDPGAEIAPGINAKTAYDQTAARMARTTDPQAKADMQAYMDALLDAHGKVEKWDPSAPVSSLQLRDSLTRAAKTVENTMGALNEKVSYQKAQDLARPVYDAYDAHIGRVAKKDPELADAISEMERQGSAHLRIKDVLKERALHAEEKQLAGSSFDLKKMSHHPGAEGAALAIAHGKPGRAAALYATTGIPRMVRAADKAMAALVKKASRQPITPVDAAVAEKAGVPRQVIDRLLRSAARSVVSGITDVAPRAAATIPASQERRETVGAGASALPAEALQALFGGD